MEQTEKVQYGDMVKINYVGKLSDGDVFDSTEGQEPHEFPAGYGTIIKGLDEAVLGMGVGEEKEVTLKPDMAYGERDDNLYQEVPRSMFEGAEEEPKEGVVVMVRTKTGHNLPATITAVGDESVKLDFNHPLAGKTLTFSIKVVDIAKGAADSCGCGCGCGDTPDMSNLGGGGCGSSGCGPGGCG